MPTSGFVLVVVSAEYRFAKTEGNASVRLKTQTCGDCPSCVVCEKKAQAPRRELE